MQRRESIRIIILYVGIYVLTSNPCSLIIYYYYIVQGIYSMIVVTSYIYEYIILIYYIPILSAHVSAEICSHEFRYDMTWQSVEENYGEHTSRLWARDKNKSTIYNIMYICSYLKRAMHILYIYVCYTRYNRF